MSVVLEDRSETLRAVLARYRRVLEAPVPYAVAGRLSRMVGFTLEASGCQAAVGSLCEVQGADGSAVQAEVVGFAGDRLYLMPVDAVYGMVPNARVVPTGGVCRAPVGPALLGRVLDGSGRPLDGRGPVRGEALVSLHGRELNPLDRRPIREPLDVGVRAINALLTVGRGQRLGLFAGSGVGKSMLLGMMTRFTEADVIVVALIGERGREVKEFIEDILGPEGLARSVVIAAPADAPPLLRVHGATLATSTAEYFRDQGRNVLLLMDSLTRYAQAWREISLAVGEPPATKGYTPSVFARIPQLVERAGNDAAGGGSITAFYTVLVEGDDHQEPIADAARAILDGHVVLSRRLAESGHYPAIDIESSVSRAMPAIVAPAHLQSAQRLKQLYASYQQHRDLIAVGAYVDGSDPEVDEARRCFPALRKFLAQALDQPVDLGAAVAELTTLLPAGAK